MNREKQFEGTPLMDDLQTENELAADDGPHFALPSAVENYAAWEEVGSGRFMPRRVRGSCVGRALG